jgi:hypothetical protein
LTLQLQSVGVSVWVELIDAVLDRPTLSVKVDALDPQDRLALQTVDLQSDIRWRRHGGDYLLRAHYWMRQRLIEQTQDRHVVRDPLSLRNWLSCR